MAEPKDEFIRKATAHNRGGAGSHNDRRARRQRTRKAARLAALKDQKEEA